MTRNRGDQVAALFDIELPHAAFVTDQTVIIGPDEPVQDMATAAPVHDRCFCV